MISSLFAALLASAGAGVGVSVSVAAQDDAGTTASRNEPPRPFVDAPATIEAADDNATPPRTAPTGPVANTIVEGAADRYTRMTVPVRIGDAGPFRFMIDTGAQSTVVTGPLRDQLDLAPAGSTMILGMASTRRVPLVWLDGLEFASRSFGEIAVPLLEANNIGADGILGLDSLQDMRVLIDFRDNTIAVDDAQALGGDRGYEIIIRARRKLGRLIISSSKIDGVETALIVDTGSQASFGNASLLRRLRTRTQTDNISRDVNGVELTGKMQRVRRLQIGDMQLNDVPITFADSPVFEKLGLDRRPALIIGMANLRLFDRVSIDFEARKILFDIPRDAPYRKQRTRPFRPSD